jgi:hypothetical protein
VTFKSGDVVVDVHCTGGKFRSRFGFALVGVVARVDDDAVWGDWLYAQGWNEDRSSLFAHVQLFEGDADAVFADWTAWRLTR